MSRPVLLRHAIVLVVMMAAVGLALGASAGPVAPDLATFLGERHGLVLVGEAVEAAGRTVFLARPEGSAAGAPADVHVVRLERGADRRVVGARGLRNLSRTQYGDETNLLGDGDRVAFCTRIYGRVETITVMDLRADDPALVDGWGWLDRSMDAVTSWEEVGALAGIDVRRFELVEPAARVELAFGAGAGAGGGATLDLLLGTEKVRLDAAAVAADGTGVPAALRYLPREKGRRVFIHWAVDTVRDGGYLPDGTIDWAKSRFNSVMETVDWVRYAFGGDELDEADAALAARAADASEFSGARVEGWPPKAIATKLKGIPWHPVEHAWLLRNPGAPEPLYLTAVRPYEERPGAWFDVVAWDPGQVELNMVAGTREPMSATGHIGSGRVPRGPGILRLLGTFNGAFQGDHGNYGMMVERATLLPPKDLSATVAVFPDGSAGFGSWPVGAPVPASVVSFRQNLSPLLALGVVNPHGRTWWGNSTVKDDLEDESRTTRTGLCLTEDGRAAYFWGRRANWREMAEVMKLAGCAYGMHLDMNPGHCGAELYRVHDPEAKKYDVARMSEHMGHMNFPRWIKTDARDFFYLTLKPVLPSADVTVGSVKWSAAGLPQAGMPPTFVLGSTGEGAPTLLKVDPRRVRPDIRAGSGEPESTTGSVGTVRPKAADGREPDAGEAALFVSLGVTDPVATPGLMAERSMLFPPRAALPTIGVRCGKAVGVLGERTECRAEVARWGAGFDLTTDVTDFKQGLPLADGARAYAAVGFDVDGFIVVAASEKGDAATLRAALAAAGVVSEPMALDLGGRKPAIWAETADGARRFLVGDEIAAAGVSALRLVPTKRVTVGRLWEDVDRVTPKAPAKPGPPMAGTKPAGSAAPKTGSAAPASAAAGMPEK